MSNKKISTKTSKQIERHMKGVSNHWRIDMILFIGENETATLEEMVDALKINVKTASEHARRLTQAGLVNKKYVGRNVEHSLSPYGKHFVRFINHFKKTF